MATQKTRDAKFEAFQVYYDAQVAYEKARAALIDAKNAFYACETGEGQADDQANQQD